MKQLFKGLLLIFLMISCSKDTGPNGQPNLADGEALVTLKINSEHSIALKSASLPEASNDYLVVVNNNRQEVVKSGTYAEFKIPFALITGRGYSISAENINEGIALSARGNRGEARYAGATGFDVLKGEEAAVSLTCSMVNARVSVGFTDNFKAHFSDYSVTITETTDPTRIISFDKNAIITEEATWGYFNIDSDPEIEISITSTRNDGVIKTFTQKSTIAAKNWVKLNFNVLITEGETSLDITVDKTVTEANSSLELNPYDDLIMTIPAQSNNDVWSEHIFVTPLTITDMVTEEPKEAILGNMLYEASSDGTNWTSSEFVDGKHKISGLTANTPYTLRARYFSVVSKNTQSFTTELGTQLENGGFENWSYDEIKKTFSALKWITFDYLLNTANNGVGIWSTANAKSTNGASGGTSSGLSNRATFWRWYSGTKATDDKKIGNYAAQISTMGFYTQAVGAGGWDHDETYDYGGRRIDIGLLFTGTYDVNNGPKLGVPHTSRPLSISFDYKYAPYSKTGTDNCLAYAKIYDANNNVIATTIDFTSTGQPSYSTQTLEFKYSSLETKAAEITVYFQSSKNDVTYFNNTQLIERGSGGMCKSNNTIVGSVLKIDNVILNY